MIQFKCPECGRSIETSAERSQKRVPCPHCLEVVLVPREPKLPPSATAATLQDSGLVPWLNDGMQATCVPQFLEGDAIEPC